MILKNLQNGKSKYSIEFENRCNDYYNTSVDYKLSNKNNTKLIHISLFEIKQNTFAYLRTLHEYRKLEAGSRRNDMVEFKKTFFP